MNKSKAASANESSGRRPLMGWTVRYWFFLCIAVVVPAGILIPSASGYLKQWHVLKLGIFSVFLITGLTIDFRHIRDARQNLTAIAAALFSSLVLFPLLIVLTCRLTMAGLTDLSVGFMILAVSPVTIASGAVMTSIAGGNIPLSLFICVAGNMASIFTVPLSLEWMLQSQKPIELPAAEMIISLFLLIIVPVAIGQFFHTRLKTVVNRWKTGCSVFSQLVVLLIIFNAVTSSAARVGNVDAALGWFLLPAVVLHGVIVLANLCLSRLLRLDRPSAAAFTIQTSQKTLTVSYLVWSGYFAESFPMAVIPAIGYHLTQMIADTLIAHRMHTWICRQVRHASAASA